MEIEASYHCDFCGEEIVVLVDPTEGRSSRYVEDCPVCCHPHVLRVEVAGPYDVRVWSERE